MFGVLVFVGCRTFVGENWATKRCASSTPEHRLNGPIQFSGSIRVSVVKSWIAYMYTHPYIAEHTPHTRHTHCLFTIHVCIHDTQIAIDMLCKRRKRSKKKITWRFNESKHTLCGLLDWLRAVRLLCICQVTIYTPTFTVHADTVTPNQMGTIKSLHSFHRARSVGSVRCNPYTRQEWTTIAVHINDESCYMYQAIIEIAVSISTEYKYLYPTNNRS